MPAPGNPDPLPGALRAKRLQAGRSFLGAGPPFFISRPMPAGAPVRSFRGAVPSEIGRLRQKQEPTALPSGERRAARRAKAAKMQAKEGKFDAKMQRTIGMLPTKMQSNQGKFPTKMLQNRNKFPQKMQSEAEEKPALPFSLGSAGRPRNIRSTHLPIRCHRQYR